MDIKLKFEKLEKYHSHSQSARIITESWAKQNMYCPRCGNARICHFKNNRPVADFYCENCKNEYELKSKNGLIVSKIADGAYRTMIERITSDKNPDFFFMSYSLEKKKVIDFIIMPKIFFVPSIIEKRKPLSEKARRAGWVGCNILLKEIPKQGKIYVIKNSEELPKESVVANVQLAQNLKIQNIESRGWLLDVLNCINQIEDDTFSLNEIYKFEELLSTKHPNNHNVLPKIRQQLQFLRDRKMIEFLGNGKYRKCS